MCTFDENGFLEGRIEKWIADHRERNAALFSSGRRLNRECHRFLDARAVDPRSDLQVTTSVLFARMMELYQGIFIVIEQGMMAAGRILFRAHLEAFFYFAAIHKDPGFLKEYLNQFHIHRKALVNRIRNCNAPGIDEIRERLNDDLISEIEETIEEEGIRRVTTEEAARRAGLHSIYVTAYALLSGAVHTTTLDLESHLDYNEQEKSIRQFKYGPSDDETRRVICLAGMVMVEALENISRTFGEDRDKVCGEMKNMFQDMLNKAPV
jgi:hypothetical protein